MVRVVLAGAKYEAWFLAAAASIGGQCGLPEHIEAPDTTPRNPFATPSGGLPK